MTYIASRSASVASHIVRVDPVTVTVVRKRIVAAVVIGGLACSGCQSGTTEPELSPPAPPNARAYVTDAAFDNLDAKGHFRLLSAVAEGPYEIISAGQAEAIALGVIRTWYANPNVLTLPGATGLAEAVERTHGAPIKWAAIRSTGRLPYFAESHLEPLPLVAGNPAIRDNGPHFIVPLYVGATPVVVIGVAAYATNIVLDENGFVRRADNLDGGGEFGVSAIPLSLSQTSIPPTPEAAVEFAFRETGVKIDKIPMLGGFGNRIVRTAVRWRLHLAAPVEFELLINGASLVTQDVYVGLFQSAADARESETSMSSAPRLRMYVAARTQPATETIGSIDVQLRRGYAVNLHEVRVRR